MPGIKKKTMEEGRKGTIKNHMTLTLLGIASQN